MSFNGAIQQKQKCFWNYVHAEARSQSKLVFPEAPNTNVTLRELISQMLHIFWCLFPYREIQKFQGPSMVLYVRGKEAGRVQPKRLPTWDSRIELLQADSNWHYIGLQKMNQIPLSAASICWSHENSKNLQPREPFPLLPYCICSDHEDAWSRCKC